MRHDMTGGQTAQIGRAPNFRKRLLQLTGGLRRAAVSRQRLLLLGAAAALAIVVASPPAAAESPQPVTTVVNGDAAGSTIRFAAGGDAVDAHDGEIRRFGNRYYLYGTSYGCGYEWQRPGRPFCGFRSYSSTDLVHWRDEGFLFDASTAQWQQRCSGNTYGCYRPHVAFNEAKRKYVLWINSYDIGVGYHVFTADRPAGPFVEQRFPTLAVTAGVPAGLNNGDHDVFVDRDGTAYLAFTDWRRGGDIVVEKLDPEYLTGTGEYVRLGLTGVEAPSMFERGGRYYLTLSDPNCGYCTTGTSYLTAPSPLGPWTGAPVKDTWRITDGALLVEGGGVGLSKAGAQWTDYDLTFTVTPLQSASQGGHSYAQAGWVFRASDPGTGYSWLLGNYPHAGAVGGNLTKIIWRGGGIASAKTVPTPMPIEGGRSYAVRTQVAGSTIRTWVDGVLIDETTDSTYRAGRVGFRESGGSDHESARFVDVKVIASDGTVLLADDFAGDLAAWDRPALPPTGIKISNDSCGGQPADVVELPARQGKVYLYQSDLWENGAPNEALARHHWEPLRFRADGSIEPLACGRSYDLPLAGLHATTGPALPAGTDVTTGDVGFQAFCDVARQIQRAQTFTIGRSGRLEAVAYTTFQSGHADGPLVLEVTRLGPDGRPGTVVARREVAAAGVSWSPSRVVVEVDLDVAAGERFALVVRSTAARGCYGMAYNDADPYPTAGGALYSNDGGMTWREEAGRDLRLDTTVRTA
ncbi:family 43 glycosylhydrolase [Micromonospora sp. NPDC093277]|uniref:family 43 glycosylhydrolase n=1 Tax=Micromonospora sp. NPDC093277 TaxID=3364291 RepID=UPI00380BBC05